MGSWRTHKKVRKTPLSSHWRQQLRLFLISFLNKPLLTHVLCMKWLCLFTLSVAARKFCLHVMGAMACAHLDGFQMTSPEMFPRCFKNSSSFQCQFWELLKGETAPSRLPRWQEVQLWIYSTNQKTLPCCRVGKLNCAAEQVGCNPPLPVCITTSSAVPWDCITLACFALLYLPLLQGGKEQSLPELL